MGMRSLRTNGSNAEYIGLRLGNILSRFCDVVIVQKLIAVKMGGKKFSLRNRPSVVIHRVR